VRITKLLGYLVIISLTNFVFLESYAQEESAYDLKVQQLLVFVVIAIIFIAIVWKFLPQSSRRYSTRNQFTGSPNYKYLKRKPFDIDIELAVLKAQGRKCNICHCELSRDIMEFDHINGDKTNNDVTNCQALCANCHRRKTNEESRFRRTGI